jgi:peptidyl-prolyl cis-trans isomerase C
LPSLPRIRRFRCPIWRELLINYVIDLKIGTLAAEAAKLSDNQAVQRRLAYMRQKTLVDEYLEREVKKAITPDSVRKFYDETVKTLKPEEEVRARHILVESEDEIKKIAARLKTGEDFVKLAGEISKDPGSKKEGGDLGFFTRDRMVAPFADAAFRLQPGQVSEPVKTQFGWHIIRLEEKRMQPVPPFEQMKEQVENYLARKTQQDTILALRNKAKIERIELPPAPVTPPASVPPPTPGTSAPAPSALGKEPAKESKKP